MGNVTNDDMTATMLDLADRHVIVLEAAVDEGHGLLGRDHEHLPAQADVRRRQERAKLRPHEGRLLELLFDRLASADSFLMSDLRDMAKADRTGFTKAMTEFKAEVQQGRRGARLPRAQRRAGASAAPWPSAPWSSGSGSPPTGSPTTRS